MTTDEIEPFAQALELHFPHASDGDAPLLWEALKPYTLAVASKAIERHRVDQGLQAFRPDSKAVTRIAAGLATPANGGPVAAVRINGLTDDERREERQRAQAFVAKLETAEREHWRKVALERMNADVRSFYAKRDAVKCPALAIAVAALAMNRQPVLPKGA